MPKSNDDLMDRTTKFVEHVLKDTYRQKVDQKTVKITAARIVKNLKPTVRIAMEQKESLDRHPR